jgi:signal transduction histidine kinase
VARTADPTVRERRWTLRRRLGGAFTAAAGVFAVLVAAVVISTIGFVSSANDVIYTWQPAIINNDQVFASLLDEETGLRGYALSHDTSFLQPYRQAITNEKAREGRVRSLIKGDARLQTLFAAEESAITAWKKAIADPAVAGIGQGDSAATALAGSLDGKRLFDAIRSRVNAFRADLVTRTLSARNDRTRWGIVFVTVLSIALVLLVGIGVMIWRGLHRWVLGPADRLGAQTRQVASGDTHREIRADGPAELTELGRDVEAMRLQIASELARAEAIQEELRRSGEELARSNEDLQQFAYVASHDLSEPLRKVANFCQLLERQYAPQLDDRARQYIDFAVDGAKRMQVLITDLLALSRVGRTTDEFRPVSLERAIEQALSTLGDRLAESGGRVEHPDPLPTVAGDRSLLTSLLENLIGNAVKYRREGVPPVVTVTAEHQPDRRRWQFTVADNGIGIDAQYAERIFAVFQRLHLRDQYGGTGIGLALCRRIVEFHGGQIWLADVESPASSAGATFRFTLPEAAPAPVARLDGDHPEGGHGAESRD